jgi:hypothetical protein
VLTLKGAVSEAVHLTRSPSSEYTRRIYAQESRLGERMTSRYDGIPDVRDGLTRAERVVMAILLCIALLSLYHPPDAEVRRAKLRPWLLWIGLFLLADLAVAYLANSPIAGSPALRRSMEGGALVLSSVNVTMILLRRIRSPLMVIFTISVTAFALSSLAFLLASPWNHMWWLAHAIFAAGFFLLSYGVVRAFLTTRSFSTIYSQEEMMARLAEASARTESALRELRLTNETLERLAATDPLTGADNRRRFIEHVEAEIQRVRRGGASFCVLALDLDNFKSVNDRSWDYASITVMCWRRSLFA